MSDGILSESATENETEDIESNVTTSAAEGGMSYHAAIKEDGSFEPGWQENLTGDYAAAAKTAANFKSVPELAKAYYEARKEISSRGESISVPNSESTPEQIDKYRKALGIPDTPEDYKLEKPEEVPDDLWDKSAADKYSEIFHRLNIPPAAAKELVNAQLEIEKGRAEVAEAAKMGEIDRARQDLQAEFGNEMTKQVDLARRIAITSGQDPNDPAFNNATVVKALAYAGRNMGEDRLVSANDSSITGAGSSMARAKDIAQNPQNPLHEKYLAGDPDAVSMVTRLIQGKI